MCLSLSLFLSPGLFRSGLRSVFVLVTAISFAFAVRGTGLDVEADARGSGLAGRES
jgi:hypothetical protein